MTQAPSKKVHFPHLDAFRTLAFLSVFFSHSFHSDFEDVRAHPVYRAAQGLTDSGYLGVNFFFVLSGFLITYLLLAEREVSGKIHIGAFYLRRVLRIWPLYYLTVAMGFIAFPILKTLLGGTPDETASPWMFVLFLANYDVMRAFPDASILGVLWSVSVEEQFYLAWPIVVASVPARRLPAVLAVLCLLSVCYRVYVAGDIARSTFATPCCVVDLAFGGLAACALHQKWRAVAVLEDAPKSAIVTVYLLGVVALVALAYTRDTLVGGLLERPLLTFVFGFAILEQTVARNSFVKMGSFRLLTRLGTYTYGLYCLHFVGILVATQVSRRLRFDETWWGEVFLETGLALAIAFVVAIASYHGFEQHFLRLKSRFAFVSR